MARAQRLEEPRSAVLPILFGMIALMAGLMVARSPLYLPFVLIAALLVAGIAFLKTEWAIHLLVLSMLLSPEFTAAGGLGTAGSVEGSKGAVLRLEDVLLVVIGVAWLARMAVHKQLSPLLRNVMNRSIGLYVLVAFLSTLIGIMGGRVHPMLGLAYVFKYMEYFVIFFLALHHISDWKALRRILITSGVTAMIVSINGIFQIPSGRRVSAPFEGEVGEPNTLGGYLVLMMAIFGAMALEAPRRKQRVLLGSCVAVMGIPLLYTLSRSSWMAAAAATVFLLFTTRKKFRLVMVLIVIISCLLAFIASQGGGTVPIHVHVPENICFGRRRFPGSVRIGASPLMGGGCERLRETSVPRIRRHRLPFHRRPVFPYSHRDRYPGSRRLPLPDLFPGKALPGRVTEAAPPSLAWTERRISGRSGRPLGARYRSEHVHHHPDHGAFLAVRRPGHPIPEDRPQTHRSPP